MSAAGLSQAERDSISQFLSKPLAFPPEFRNWLTDYLAVNTPFIPVSQLLGYKGTLANIAVADARGNWTGLDAPERTWNSAPDGLGPSITGLADGTYFVMWGYNEPGENAGGARVRVGPSVNGASPSYYIESAHTDQGWTNWSCQQVSVTGGNDNNTIELKYYYDLNSGADAEFQYRWVAAIRVT